MSIRQDIFEKLVGRAAPLFGMKPEELAETTRFAEDCKAKSTHFSQITTYLEDEFDTEIPYMSFRRQKTIGEAVDYVLTECLGEELDAEDVQESVTPVSTASVKVPVPAPAAAPEVSGEAEESAKSDHDDELAARERFTLKETFQGEELEAVYMVARKPVAVDPSVDLAASDDPMARMGQGDKWKSVSRFSDLCRYFPPEG